MLRMTIMTWYLAPSKSPLLLISFLPLREPTFVSCCVLISLRVRFRQFITSIHRSLSPLHIFQWNITPTIKEKGNPRCIGLESICHNPQSKTAEKAPNPNRLPPLLLGLLSGLHTEEPPRRRIVMVFMSMICSPLRRRCRERTSGCDLSGCFCGRFGDRVRGAQREGWAWHRHCVESSR